MYNDSNEECCPCCLYGDGCRCCGNPCYCCECCECWCCEPPDDIVVQPTLTVSVHQPDTNETT